VHNIHQAATAVWIRDNKRGNRVPHKPLNAKMLVATLASTRSALLFRFISPLHNSHMRDSNSLVARSPARDTRIPLTKRVKVGPEKRKRTEDRGGLKAPYIVSHVNFSALRHSRTVGFLITAQR